MYLNILTVALTMFIFCSSTPSLIYNVNTIIRLYSGIIDFIAIVILFIMTERLCFERETPKQPKKIQHIGCVHDKIRD